MDTHQTEVRDLQRLSRAMTYRTTMLSTWNQNRAGQHQLDSVALACLRIAGHVFVDENKLGTNLGSLFQPVSKYQ